MFCLLLVMATAVFLPPAPASCPIPLLSSTVNRATFPRVRVRLNGTPWPLCWVVSQIRMLHAPWQLADHRHRDVVALCVCVPDWANLNSPGHPGDPLPTGQLALISFNCVCQTQMHFNANNARQGRDPGEELCAVFFQQEWAGRRGTFWATFPYEQSY